MNFFNNAILHFFTMKLSNNTNFIIKIYNCKTIIFHLTTKLGCSHLFEIFVHHFGQNRNSKKSKCSAKLKSLGSHGSFSSEDSYLINKYD